MTDRELVALMAAILKAGDWIDIALRKIPHEISNAPTSGVPLVVGIAREILAEVDRTEPEKKNCAHSFVPDQFGAYICRHCGFLCMPVRTGDLNTGELE